jgi:cardiolipin synthase A/B
VLPNSPSNCQIQDMSLARSPPASRRAHWPLAMRGAFIALLLATTACAAVPGVDQSVADSDVTTSSKPRIVGADGPLTSGQGQALLTNIAGGAGQDKLLHRHRAVEEAVAGTPLTAGNATRLLRDGEGAFAAIFKEIHAARHHINLEYYTLEDVTYGGERLSDLLVAKRTAGVAINVIYDSYGSSSSPVEFFERLKTAGVNVLEFHPVNPLEAAAGGYSPNDRNHRKIMIVDGNIGIVGGVNLAAYYQSKIPGSKPAGAQPKADAVNPVVTAPPEVWRDLALRIEGPAVAQLQRLFLGHWQSGGGPKLDQTGFFPDLPAKDGEVIRIIGSSPQQDISRYYVTLISSMRNAEQRIWLTTAYFVPTSEELDTLKDAAERGVDVRLMLPANSDAGPAMAVARSHYTDLLESGVRIFEVDGIILHSKTVTIDGVWSAIGSSNFDHRSVLFNDEVDAIVLGTDTARDLEERFEEDRKVAKEIDLEIWRERPLRDRIGDFIQRTGQFLF